MRVEEIASRADVSLKTFFNYFQSKQSVLDEYARRLLDGFDEQLRATIANESIDVPQRIEALVQNMGRAVERDRRLARIVFTESKLFSADPALRDRELVTYRLLAALFERGQKRGEIRSDLDPTHAAELLVGVYYFATANWLSRWWGRGTSPLSPRLRAGVRVLLRGMSSSERECRRGGMARAPRGSRASR